MKRRSVCILAVGVLAAAAMAGGPLLAAAELQPSRQAAAEGGLDIALLPGGYQALLRQTVIPAFEQAAHMPVRVNQWGGTLEELNHLAGAGGSDSVVELSEDTLLQACDRGLLQPVASMMEAGAKAASANTAPAPVQSAPVQPAARTAGTPAGDRAEAAGEAAPEDQTRAGAAGPGKASANGGDPFYAGGRKAAGAITDGLNWLQQGRSRCGLGAWMRSTVLVWDESKLKSIAGWSDFWDIAKYPGKRGLRRGAEGNLEIALMADGVSPSDVYGVLATKDGQERAFRKMEQLRPYIVWWDTDAQAVHLMASGEVLMESAPAEQIFLASRSAGSAPPGSGGTALRYGVQWNGSLYRIGWWGVPAGVGADAALAFLRFMAGPDIQQSMAEQAGIGVLAKDALGKLAPQVVRWMPSVDSHLQQALKIDPAFWSKNSAALNGRMDTLMK